MAVYFTADPHFGHANIIVYCHRPFADVEEMDAALVANFNQTVGPEDTLYLLGDFCLPRGGASQYLARAAAYRERIQCRHVVLIAGNHDRPELAAFRRLFADVRDLLEVRVEGHRLVLCHYAMRVWNASHHGSWHLFGHDHGTLPDDPRLLAFDVGVDCWDYRPLSFAEVAEVMERRKAARSTS